MEGHLDGRNGLKKDLEVGKNESCLEQYMYKRAFLVTQMVKNLPASQETQVQSLGQEDSLEKGMATHSSILTWRIPTDRGAWGATVHRVTKSRS